MTQTLTPEVRRRDKRPVSRARRVLRVARIVGVLAAVAVCAIVWVGGVGLHAVTSGSMEPQISIGDLVVTRPAPAATVQVGDIVTVPSNRGGTVTHRVEAVDSSAGGTTLTLKGDANQGTDLETYPVDTVQAHVLTVPRGGALLGEGLQGATPWLLALGVLVPLRAVLTRPRTINRPEDS